jgi:secretion/DNA translocation related TadE-like protein
VTLRRRGDDGIATVVGLALAVVLIGAGAVVSSIVSVYVAHQRAAVAADLASLAGAVHGCAQAERVALAHGAVSVSCEIIAGDAVVTVAIPPPELLQRLARWTGNEAPVVASTSRAGAT